MMMNQIETSLKTNLMSYLCWNQMLIMLWMTFFLNLQLLAFLWFKLRSCQSRSARSMLYILLNLWFMLIMVLTIIRANEFSLRLRKLFTTILISNATKNKPTHKLKKALTRIMPSKSNRFLRITVKRFSKRKSSNSKTSWLQVWMRMMF